jgi:hypothetical protein
MSGTGRAACFPIRKHRRRIQIGIATTFTLLK